MTLIVTKMKFGLNKFIYNDVTYISRPVILRVNDQSSYCPGLVQVCTRAAIKAVFAIANPTAPEQAVVVCPV